MRLVTSPATRTYPRPRRHPALGLLFCLPNFYHLKKDVDNANLGCYDVDMMKQPTKELTLENSTTITTRVTLQMAEKLSQVAAEEDRTVSYLLRLMLEDYLEQWEPTREM